MHTRTEISSCLGIGVWEKVPCAVRQTTIGTIECLSCSLGGNLSCWCLDQLGVLPLVVLLCLCIFGFVIASEYRHRSVCGPVDRFSLMKDEGSSTMTEIRTHGTTGVQSCKEALQPQLPPTLGRPKPCPDIPTKELLERARSDDPTLTCLTLANKGIRCGLYFIWCSGCANASTQRCGLSLHLGGPQHQHPCHRTQLANEPARTRIR